MADNEYLRAGPEGEYALSGKIMLGGVVLLFAIILFMVGLHLYARWYVVRLRRRQLEHRRGQRRMLRSQIVMYLETRLPAADRGLDRAILSSLPVFLYSPSPAPSECAVCLSEFEERETVRQLPRCGHSFHIGCIDMWFLSHSTCPLCRAPVEPAEKKPPEPEETAEKPEPVSSSGSDPGAAGDTATSLGARRKGLGAAGVRIEVPPRSAELDSELTQNSPAGRILALRRMLSMRRRSPATTPYGASELDLESGLSGTSRGLNRVGTPS